MPIVKAFASLLDPTQEVAQNTLVVGAEGDIGGCYAAALEVFDAITNETAHAGTEFLIEVSSDQHGSEGWTLFHRFLGVTGTGNQEAVLNNPASAGSTVLSVASTIGYTANGAKRFLEDIGSFPDSEWLRQRAYASNATVALVDGTARQHAQNSLLHSTAASRRIALPMDVRRVRLIVNNCYAPSGATVAFRTVLTKVTAV